MACDLCAKPQHYCLTCLSCCARLLASAPVAMRPVMLLVIARQPGSPSESAIKAEANRVRAARAGKG